MAEFFLQIEIFLTRCIEIQNTHFMFNSFIKKSHHLWENVEKYCTVRQVTDGNIIWHMHFACWITVARIHTHRLCNVYWLSMATCYMFVPQYCVTCTLPILVCWSLIARTATDNSKIKLQAVAPCPMRTSVVLWPWKGENVFNIRLKEQQ